MCTISEQFFLNIILLITIQLHQINYIHLVSYLDSTIISLVGKISYLTIANVNNVSKLN